MPEQVAIAVIATGGYVSMLKGFAESMSRYMMPDVQRKLVVLSNTPVYGGNVVWAKPKLRGGFSTENVKRRKFDILGNAEGRFDGCSHILYLDVTMRAMRNISFNDVFGDGNSLVGLAHSWMHYGLEPNRGTCKQALAARAFAWAHGSAAYIPETTIADATGGWLIGGLMGGPAKLFIEACRTCSDWIGKDCASGNVPKFYDEPYWNSFAARNGVLVLPPEYGWPDINSSGKVRNPKMRVALKNFSSSGVEMADRAKERIIKLDYEF